MRPVVLLLMRDVVRRGMLRGALEAATVDSIRPATQACIALDHALQVAATYKPLVAIIDANGFEGDGIQLLLKIGRETHARLLFVANQKLTPEFCEIAHRAGARGIYGPDDENAIALRTRQLLREATSTNTVSGRVVSEISGGTSSSEVGPQ